jgi:hypothetical protein
MRSGFGKDDKLFVRNSTLDRYRANEVQSKGKQSEASK